MYHVLYDSTCYPFIHFFIVASTLSHCTYSKLQHLSPYHSFLFYSILLYYILFLIVVAGVTYFVAVSTTGQIYRSADGGATWPTISTANATLQGTYVHVYVRVWGWRDYYFVDNLNCEFRNKIQTVIKTFYGRALLSLFSLWPLFCFYHLCPISILMTSHAYPFFMSRNWIDWLNFYRL